MKRKRLISMILALMLALCLLPAAMAAGLPFTDVPDGAWYASDVENAYLLGLINGKAPDKFAPDDNMTYAEAVKLAACMHQNAADGKITLKNAGPLYLSLQIDPQTDEAALRLGSQWYRSYVDYAYAERIIERGRDYDWDAPVTRADYIAMLSGIIEPRKHIPQYDLHVINNVPEGSVPDVPITHPQAFHIYLMYRLGIVEGVDNDFRFAPDSNLKRSEAIVFASRVLDPEKRIRFTVPAPSLSNTPDFSSAAANAINEFISTGTLPDGRKIEYTDGGEYIYDYYAVYDIDEDGKYELMLFINNYFQEDLNVESMEIIYGYNEANSTFHEEMVATDALLLYTDVGILAQLRIIMEEPGLEAIDLYGYNKDVDAYEYFASVAQWDKQIDPTSPYGNIPFPDEADNDGDGSVYLITTNGEWGEDYHDFDELNSMLENIYPRAGEDFDYIDLPYYPIYVEKLSK